jgi:predicted transglutaminase-like cysteine proteinase
MSHGDCKAYSLTKYAGDEELGIPADCLRLVIVHNRKDGKDHMIVAVYQDGEWLILNNLTNLLLRDSEKDRLRASRRAGLQGSTPLSLCFLD